MRHFQQLKTAIHNQICARIIIVTTHNINRMSQLPVITEHIEITPGICGGKPRIAGHMIKVQDIVIWHEKMGMSPDR